VIGDCVLGDSSLPAAPTNTTMLGWQSPEEINRYLCGCDVLVVPSRWEGFGLVALEAMRAGKAVIAARVGGLQEIVEDGVTGVLVGKEDHAAIVAAFRTLPGERWEEMGSAGRVRFQALFQVQRVVSDLDRLYRETMKRR
jgi:glycosyltransferase involved in cell wall biosynthesis